MAKKRYYKSSGIMPSGMGEFANLHQSYFKKGIPSPSSMNMNNVFPTTLSEIDMNANKTISMLKKIQYK